MTKICSTILLLICLLPVFAQTNTQVSGNIQGLDNDTKILFRAIHNPRQVDTLIVNKGNFLFNTNVKVADLYLLTFSSHQESYALDVFLSPGTKTSIMADDSLISVKMSGTTTAEDQSNFRLPLVLIFQEEESLHNAAKEEKDSAKLQVIENRLTDLSQRRTAYCYQWISSHSSSPFCLVVLSMYLQSEPYEKRVTIFKSLPKSAKENNAFSNAFEE